MVPLIGSQTDVATTLLRQLALPTTSYKWGRNLLGTSAVPFAYYCYDDGFGLVSPAGVVTFDNVSGRATSRTPGVFLGTRTIDCCECLGPSKRVLPITIRISQFGW